MHRSSSPLARQDGSAFPDRLLNLPSFSINPASVRTYDKAFRRPDLSKYGHEGAFHRQVMTTTARPGTSLHIVISTNTYQGRASIEPCWLSVLT
jgi:hypothetical protein